MIEASREFSFAYAHRIRGHPGKCRFLHGHNGRVRIVCRTGEPDALGMCVDFSAIKAAIGPLLEVWDHAVLLDDADPLAGVLEEHNQRVIRLPGPPTAELLAREILRQCRAKGLPAVRAEVEETPGCIGACEETP